MYSYLAYTPFRVIFQCCLTNKFYHADTVPPHPPATDLPIYMLFILTLQEDVTSHQVGFDALSVEGTN